MCPLATNWLRWARFPNAARTCRPTRSCWARTSDGGVRRWWNTASCLTTAPRWGRRWAGRWKRPALVLINGGSSRGSEDYNSELLQERATFFAHGVKAVPGRPYRHGHHWREAGHQRAGTHDRRVSGRRLAGAGSGALLLRPAHAAPGDGFGRAGQAAGRTSRLRAAGASVPTPEEDGVLHAGARVPGCATLAENMRSVNAFLAVRAGLRYEAGETAVEVEDCWTLSPGRGG